MHGNFESKRKLHFIFPPLRLRKEKHFCAPALKCVALC